jgi:hypothetical protein
VVCVCGGSAPRRQTMPQDRTARCRVGCVPARPVPRGCLTARSAPRRATGKRRGAGRGR